MHALPKRTLGEIPRGDMPSRSSRFRTNDYSPRLPKQRAEWWTIISNHDAGMLLLPRPFISYVG